MHGGPVQTSRSRSASCPGPAGGPLPLVVRRDPLPLCSKNAGTRFLLQFSTFRYKLICKKKPLLDVVVPHPCGVIVVSLLHTHQELGAHFQNYFTAHVFAGNDSNTCQTETDPCVNQSRSAALRRSNMEAAPNGRTRHRKEQEQHMVWKIENCMRKRLGPKLSGLSPGAEWVSRLFRMSMCSAVSMAS